MGTTKTQKSTIATITKELDDTAKKNLNNTRSLVDSPSKTRNRENTNFILQAEDITGEYKNDLRGSPFIIHDSGVGDEMRVVVFLNSIQTEF